MHSSNSFEECIASGGRRTWRARWRRRRRRQPPGRDGSGKGRPWRASHLACASAGRPYTGSAVSGSAIARAAPSRARSESSSVAAGRRLSGGTGSAPVQRETSPAYRIAPSPTRSEEHTSELQSLAYLVCRLLLEKKKKQNTK